MRHDSEQVVLLTHDSEQVVLAKPRKPDAPDAFWDSGPAAPAPAKASKKKK